MTNLYVSILLVVIQVFTISAQDQKASRTISPAAPKIIEIDYVDSVYGNLAEITSFIKKLQADAQSNSRLVWVAGSIITGDQKIVLLSLHSEYKHLEDWHRFLNKARFSSPQVRITLQTTVFELNTALSYNSNRISFGKAQAYSLSMMFLRRGTADDYVAEQRLAVELLNKAKIADESFISYRMAYGNNVPGYLFVAPMNSLADLDIDLSAAHQNLFSPEQDKRRYEVLKEAVVSNFNNLLVVHPELSRPSVSMIKENYAFWILENKK